MKLTTNYGLKKPEGSDVVNIDDFNYNADVLDNAIKEVKTKVDSLNLTANKSNNETTFNSVLNNILGFFAGFIFFGTNFIILR